MTNGFECSLLELDIIGDALGVNVRPFPFDFPVHGEDIEERARFIEAVQRSLAGKGLLDDSAYDPLLVRLVGLFARGRISIAMVGTVRRRTVCARASVDSQHGVLAQRQGEVVRFASITPESLVRRAVGLLPPMKAGPGGSVTLAVPEQPQAGQHARPMEDFSARTFLESVRPAKDAAATQAALAREILQRPRSGFGYFVVTERGRNNQEGEPATLTWLDTDAGRYVIVPSVGSDGRRYGTYVPADLRRVEQNLSRLVTQLV